VPALDDLGPATELAPVFAALEPEVAACTDKVAAARSGARSRIDAAHERASALLATAHLEADTARAGAAAAVNDEATASNAALLDEARDRVARVEALGHTRTAALAARLAETLLEQRAGDRP